MSAIRIRRLTAFLGVAVVLLILWTLIQDFYAISPDSLGKDASQNVRYGVNLAKHGIYSDQIISPNVAPAFRREPLPNFLLAVYLKLADMWSPGLFDQMGQPFEDAFLVFVKQINLFWAAGLFLGLWLTSQLVFSPLFAAHGLAFVQIIVVNRFFVIEAVDDMKTELLAGMVLVWLGAVLLMASRSRTWRWLLISGIAFGLMALTKATGAYVALLLLPLMALAIGGFGKHFWLSFLAISFGFVITVTPWLVRNQIHFSKPVISQGGGDVLLIRSVFNQMNWQQFGDAFYAYAPRDMRRDLLGPWMGMSDDDFSCEGRLSVFTRDLDCDQEALAGKRYGDVQSFYQRGKRGIPGELGLNRDEKKDFAIKEFRRQPLQALITGLPIGWRGFWGFRVKAWKYIALNAAAYSALLLAPLLALIERRLSWLMVSIAPVSFFLFYSFLSHFLPRYSTPFIPASLICLTMLVIDLGERIAGFIKPGRLPFVRLS